MYNLFEYARIAGAWALSFRRSTWTLADYPVRLRSNPAGDPSIAWMAQILNWPGPLGLGATPDEAREKLEVHFAEVTSNRTSMPRPGTKVAIGFAPSVRVNADADLLDDFVARILQREVWFVSDESSLYDFGGDDEVERMRGLIRSNYGVETRDFEQARLGDILERIRAARG